MQTWTIYTYAKAAASPGRMVRPSDGVTWHDGVTSDVIGASPPSSQFGNWCSGSRTLRRRKTWTCPWRIRSSST